MDNFHGPRIWRSAVITMVAISVGFTLSFLSIVSADDTPPGYEDTAGLYTITRTDTAGTAGDSPSGSGEERTGTACDGMRDPTCDDPLPGDTATDGIRETAAENPCNPLQRDTTASGETRASCETYRGGDTRRAPADAIEESGSVRGLEDIDEMTTRVNTNIGVQLRGPLPYLSGPPGSSTQPIPNFNGLNARWWTSEVGPVQIVDDSILYGLNDVNIGLINTGTDVSFPEVSLANPVMTYDDLWVYGNDEEDGNLLTSGWIQSTGPVQITGDANVSGLATLNKLNVLSGPSSFDDLSVGPTKVIGKVTGNSIGNITRNSETKSFLYKPGFEAKSVQFESTVSCADFDVMVSCEGELSGLPALPTSGWQFTFDGSYIEKTPSKDICHSQATVIKGTAEANALEVRAQATCFNPDAI